jgi:hypothetical protein
LYSIIYSVIGDHPLEVGAFQLRTTCPSPALADVRFGADGTVVLGV